VLVAKTNPQNKEEIFTARSAAAKGARTLTRRRVSVQPSVCDTDPRLTGMTGAVTISTFVPVAALIVFAAIQQTRAAFGVGA
jgi:hypothetical protein